MKLKVINTPSDMRTLRESLHGKSVGFVPTMGALHAGHENLIQKCRQDNDVCIVSIFVNPTQFNDKNDFSKYPITWESDLSLCEKNGVDFVFNPSYADIYPDDYKYKIEENSFSKLLCGGSRAGHFDGVLTIVMKLFQLVRPSNSYFGEKDYQQLSLIKGMVEAFFIPTNIIPVETVRENSGLAMSSRNMRLSENAKTKAANIYAYMRSCKNIEDVKSKLSSDGFNVDYAVDINNRRFVAATIESVRLIDNVSIK